MLSGNILPSNMFAVLFFNLQACKQVTETIKTCDRLRKKWECLLCYVIMQYTGYFQRCSFYINYKTYFKPLPITRSNSIFNLHIPSWNLQARVVLTVYQKHQPAEEYFMPILKHYFSNSFPCEDKHIR